MLRSSVVRAVCALWVCVSLAVAEDDDEIEIQYTDPYYNEITSESNPQEPTPSPAPCKSQELTKWDKLFTMLENSQMRENMLLQYADDIVKVEMGSLRGEMFRFVAQYGGSCGVALETAARRMSQQLDNHLRETLERLKLREDRNVVAPTGNSVVNPDIHEALQQLLSAARTQASRLTNMETSCFSPVAGMATGPGTLSDSKRRFQVLEDGRGHQEQEVTSPEMLNLSEMLTAVVTELKVLSEKIEEMIASSQNRHLPAGCEMALLFPMRSSRIYTAVIPEVPLSMAAFTVCLWAKPTAISNRTVLFSYGTRRNPYEIQLLLSGSSALFTVGGEAHLVEGRGVVNVGGTPQWLHLCGAWSSEQGLASLWANGRKVASIPGVAEGRLVPDGGSLQLGQERNGCCPGSPSKGGAGGSGVQGFERGFDAKLAFTGKMTGVNVWDRVLSERDIFQRASREGQGCERRGNVVAWGVTEMVPHGGAQFLN